MEDHVSRFNRLLLVLMVVLLVIALGVFTYANLRVDPEAELWMIIVNALILSLPLVLFFGAAYVLITSWREHSLTGELSPRRAKTIHWAPRIAAIVIIFFVTLFSLDVFGTPGATPLQLLGAFIMHSLPSIILTLVLVFAWRWPVVGFVAFLLAGLFFLRFVVMGRDLLNFLLFSGPLLLISGLFYADWRLHKTQPPEALDAAI